MRIGGGRIDGNFHCASPHLLPVKKNGVPGTLCQDTPPCPDTDTEDYLLEYSILYIGVDLYLLYLYYAKPLFKISEIDSY